jgi:PAS domain S-box-containing protein
MTDRLPQRLFIPMPANETERLAALRRYKILDTPPEAAFDRITTMAARLFDMPIAIVSLVDESRAWFKSCVGFDAREVPRDATLCSFAVLTDEPLIVPDTRFDERFACNPFVQSDPGVRFYAGAPLIGHDSFNIGTLCLLDTQPRDPLTPEQQATLVDLAAMVMDELELRLAAHKIAQVDAALLEITRGVEAVTGEAFFEALVQHFAKVLDTEYVYIGLIEGDDPKLMKTIATCARGQIVDNLEYLLQDTPCWEAIEQRKICCYPRNVQAHFPNAPLLKPLAVESYVAIPFCDSSDTPLGLLGVMDGKPLENVQLVESLLTIFANRIAAELERQQTEVALRKSEAKYRTLFESIDEGFCICEMLYDDKGEPRDYRFLEVNPIFAQLTGLEAATGKTARELVPNLEDYWIEIYGNIVRTGEPIRFEQQSPAMNRWFDVNAFCIDEPQNKRFAVLFTNISDRKKIERERMRFLAVGSDLQVITKIDGSFEWVSPTFQRLLDWTQEEMISCPWTDFVHPDDIGSSILETESLFSGSETLAFENRYRHKNGSYRWLLWNAQAYPDENAIYGAAIDITDRKQAEIALRQSEERFRTLADNISQFAWMADSNGWIFWYNRRWFDYTGTTLEEMQGWGWQQVHHPEHVDRVIKYVRHCFETGTEWEDTFPLRAQDGTYRWFLSRAIPIRDERGHILRWFGTNTDITEIRQVEAELRQKNAILDVIDESAPTPIFVKDRQGRIIYANPATLEVLGKSAAEVIGYRDCDLYPNPEDAAKVMENDRRVMESGETQVVEESPDGIRTFLGMKAPYRNEAGEVIGLIGISNDISDRKKIEEALQHAHYHLQQQADRLTHANEALQSALEELQVTEEELRIQNEELVDARKLTELERERYQDLFNFAPDGYVVTDASGMIQEANWAIADLLAIDRHFLVNTPLTLYFPQFKRKIFSNLLEELRRSSSEQKLQTDELSLKSRNGDLIPVAVTGTAVGDSQGRIVGVRWLIQDISDRKQIEAERAELFKQEQAARETAEQANRIKDEFLAVLSHELRSPLNPILGWTQLMQTGKLDAAQTDQALTTIERNAKLQVDLIEDLLDVSRILRGKLNLNISSIDLEPIIRSALETVRLAAEAKSIRVEANINYIGQVSGDPTRLQQVVWNLLSNAVKFTPTGGRVEVKLSKVEGLAQIVVKDNGRGIVPEFLPHVFEYFRQEDGSTTRKFGGLGLGLAIVRQIVEMHGGTIWAESAGKNRGATFIVQLPLNSQARSNESEPTFNITTTNIPLHELKILLVDDEADTREFQAFLLEQSGAIVTAVASGFEALQALDRSIPDVLISDVGMAGMDGYMLIKQIRSRPPDKGGTIPAIALTAYAGDFDRQQALQAGFQQHLTKPLDPEAFINAIAELARSD